MKKVIYGNIGGEGSENWHFRGDAIFEWSLEKHITSHEPFLKIQRKAKIRCELLLEKKKTDFEIENVCCPELYILNFNAFRKDVYCFRYARSVLLCFHPFYITAKKNN